MVIFSASRIRLAEKRTLMAFLSTKKACYRPLCTTDERGPPFHTISPRSIFKTLFLVAILYAKVKVVPGGAVPTVTSPTGTVAETGAAGVPPETAVGVHPPAILEGVARVVGPSVVARVVGGAQTDEVGVATYEAKVVGHRPFRVAARPGLVPHVADALAARPAALVAGLDADEVPAVLGLGVGVDVAKVVLGLLVADAPTGVGRPVPTLAAHRLPETPVPFRGLSPFLGTAVVHVGGVGDAGTHPRDPRPFPVPRHVLHATHTPEATLDQPVVGLAFVRVGVGQTLAPTGGRVTAKDTGEVLEVRPTRPPVDGIANVVDHRTGVPFSQVGLGDVVLLAREVRAGLATNVRAPDAHLAARDAPRLAVVAETDANVALREAPALAEVRRPVDVRQAPDVADHVPGAVLVTPTPRADDPTPATVGPAVVQETGDGGRVLRPKRGKGVAPPQGGVPVHAKIAY